MNSFPVLLLIAIGIAFAILPPLFLFALCGKDVPMGALVGSVIGITMLAYAVSKFMSRHGQ